MLKRIVLLTLATAAVTPAGAADLRIERLAPSDAFLVFGMDDCAKTMKRAKSTELLPPLEVA